jgi:hypothetical protein
MLYLKLMSGQDLPDGNPSHNFTLLEIPDGGRIDFEETEIGSVQPAIYARVTYADQTSKTIELTGNAYVLNSQGKTIASRAAY